MGSDLQNIKIKINFRQGSQHPGGAVARQPPRADFPTILAVYLDLVRAVACRAEAHLQAILVLPKIMKLLTG